MPEFVLGPEIVEGFRRLGVALAIGLLIGIERGWKDRESPEGSRTAGIRTFTLICFTGGVLGLISEQLGGVVLALGFLAAAAAMTAFEVMHARANGTSDATPLVAALLVMLLGALAGLGDFHLAAAAAVATAIVLVLKEDLHGWLKRVRAEELRGALVLAAMSMIILPLLPADPVDPWGAVNLRAVWLLTVLIAALSFLGYVAVRIVGPDRGPLLAGIAGGFVSSTATVVTISRMARRRRRGAPPIMAGAVAANAVMFGRVWVIASALRPDLIGALAAALLPAMFISASMAAWLSRRPVPPPAEGEPVNQPADLTFRNPLALGTAIGFGLFLAAVSIVAALLQLWLGDRGVYVLAAISGIADVDALMLTMTQSTQTVVAAIAATAILIAVSVNTVSKAIISYVAGGPRAGLIMAITSAIALIAAGVGYVGYLRLI